MAAASDVTLRPASPAQGVRERQVGARSWSVQGLLAEMAARLAHPAVMAVRGEAIRTMSYADIADAARRVAFGLIAKGVRVGDAVVVYGPNSPEWIIVALAVGACGAMLAPVDDVLAETDAAAIVADSGARIVFTTAAHYRALRTPAAGPQCCYLLDDAADVSGAADSWQTLLQTDPVPLPPVDGASALCLSYTSGTTGAPKAIVLSADNIGVNVLAIADEREAGPEDRILLPLPLHHSYPLVIGLLTPLTVGATIVLPEGVSGPQLVRAARLAGATALVGVPRLYEVLLNTLESRVAAAGRLQKAVFDRSLGLALWSHRLGVDIGRFLFGAIRAQVGPRLRVMICGGAKLDADVNRKLEALGWTVFAGYGLAETASVFTTNARGRTRIGSAGKPVGDGEMRIAEPRESGIGEILLKGSNITSGYRNNPEATKAAFTADGWFRTGDLGYIDEAGYLHVTGRAKEMIVLGGGKKVFPEPLEKIYAASPYIREIALLERAGDLVALVRPDVDAIKAIGVTLIEDPIRVWFSQAAQQLPPYQRLSGFVIVGQALPRTRLGKYRRFLLPQLYERALAKQTQGGPAPLSEADRAFLAEPTAAAVWALLRKRYADKPLALDADLSFDLSIDSFDWMEIALELERGLGVQLTSEMVAGLRTVRELIVAVTGLVDHRAADGNTARRWALSEEEAGWLRPTGPVANIVAAAGQAIDKLVFRWGFALHVDGIERVPMHGPFVVAPNHSSELDAFAIAAALPARLLRRSYWAGDDHRMFSTAPMRLFSRVSHVFPVDERVPMAAVMAATTVLVRGDILIWFPEGWVSPDGRLQRFRPGVGKLLTDVSAPVVPTYISGTFEAMPRGRRWPRRRPIRVAFGAPVSVDALEAAGTGDSREERIAHALRDQVAALARSIGGEP
jgi:long-chain acyl-CoA synthetase